MQKFSFLLGAGVGYVLGARSGRARYDEMVRSAQRVAAHPKVQAATETVTTQARVAAGKASATAKSAAATLQAKASDAVNRNKPVKAGPNEEWAYPTVGTGSAGAVRPGVPGQQTQ